MMKEVSTEPHREKERLYPINEEFTAVLKNITTPQTQGEKVYTLMQRLTAIDLLRAVKKLLSYRAIESITGVPSSVLCRYVQGSTIPSTTHAEKITEKLLKKNIAMKIVKALLLTYRRLKSPDPYLIKYIATYFMYRLLGKYISLIVTETTNIILLIGYELSSRIGAHLLQIPDIRHRRLGKKATIALLLTDINASIVAEIMRDLAQNINKVIALLGLTMSERPLGLPSRIEIHVILSKEENIK